MQPCGHPAGVGRGQQLGEHRSGVPVDVPETALPVAPAGPPRDPGDDDRGRSSERGRPDPNERVIVRVVVMHARGQGRAVGNGDVHLQREAATGGPRGPEQPGRVGPIHGSHDPGGEVEQPRELWYVGSGDGDVRSARHHGEGRSRRARQFSRKLQTGERRFVSLVEPGESSEIVHLEVRHDPGVVDRRIPLLARLVRGEPMKGSRCGLDRTAPGRRPRSLPRHGAQGSGRSSQAPR